MATDLERWAPELAADLERTVREFPEMLDTEAVHLRDALRRRAPRRSGRLRRGIEAKGSEVVTDVPYAEIQSTGGTIKAIRHGWLTIPVRPGYQPSAGYVTVRGRDGNQYVIRSGSMELWAIRRRQVRIRGSRYLETGLQDHLRDADERIARRLIDEVT